MKFISIFNNESFDEYKDSIYNNKQAIRLRFQHKGAMLLKCKSTPVKVGLRYTLTSNSPSQIVTSMSRNGSKRPEAFSRVKRKFGCWLFSTFRNT